MTFQNHLINAFCEMSSEGALSGSGGVEFKRSGFEGWDCGLAQVLESKTTAGSRFGRNSSWFCGVPEGVRLGVERRKQIKKKTKGYWIQRSVLRVEDLRFRVHG